MGNYFLLLMGLTDTKKDSETFYLPIEIYLFPNDNVVIGCFSERKEMHLHRDEPYENMFVFFIYL